MQSQHQYNSKGKGREGHPLELENRALPLCELIKMRKSSSYDEDAKLTQRLSRCSNSLITDRVAEAVSVSGATIVKVNAAGTAAAMSNQKPRCERPRCEQRCE